MAFSRPISIAGFPLSSVLVRTSDFRGRYQLPTEAQPDPNEVVVTGAGRRSRAQLIVALAEDRLEACSSITYQRASQTLVLRCRTGG